MLTRSQGMIGVLAFVDDCEDFDGLEVIVRRIETRWMARLWCSRNRGFRLRGDEADKSMRWEGFAGSLEGALDAALNAYLTHAKGAAHE